jgi:hypothetical protein
MTNIKTWNAVYGLDRAAASVRPSAAPSFARNLGGELCPKHAEQFVGMPGTQTSAARLRKGVGDLPVITVQKFAFDIQSVPGSSVWRPPV